MLKADLLRTYGMVSGNRLQRVIACYRTPGVHAVIVFRFGGWILRRTLLLRLLLTPIYLYLHHRIKVKWGIDIPRSTRIGEGLYLGHFGGIILSNAAVIGRNANISQQVTIGVSGQGEKMGCPVIGDNVYLAPGAKVFGKIRIGDNVKIGANAVVYKDIPDNAVVVMDPGFRIISYKGNA
jgi:serine O-acetyltransferase